MSSILSHPEHPIFQKSNLKGLQPKIDNFEPEWFAQKFSISLMKLMELKGLHLKMQDHSHENIFQPQMESGFTDLLAFEIIHETSHMGFLYLEVNFVSLLIHKVLGGSDKVIPSKVNLPLGKIEEKGLASVFGIMNLSLREGLKRSFPLREIDHIELKGPIDEFKFPYHLENSQQYLKQEFTFQGPIDVKLCILFESKTFLDLNKKYKA